MNLKVINIIGMIADLQSEFSYEKREWIADEGKDILSQGEELKEMKSNLDRRVNNLFNQIQRFKEDLENPELPFERPLKDYIEEPKSCNLDCENCSEPCDKLGEPEKGTSEDLNKQMIEQLITHYASSDPNVDVDKIKSSLKWKSAKEIKKLIYELKNNSEKKLDAEIAQKVFLKNKRG